MGSNGLQICQLGWVGLPMRHDASQCRLIGPRSDEEGRKVSEQLLLLGEATGVGRQPPEIGLVAGRRRLGGLGGGTSRVEAADHAVGVGEEPCTERVGLLPPTPRRRHGGGGIATTTTQQQSHHSRRLAIFGSQRIERRNERPEELLHPVPNKFVGIGQQCRADGDQCLPPQLEQSISLPVVSMLSITQQHEAAAHIDQTLSHRFADPVHVVPGQRLQCRQ
mmetsp:Transcript_13992/g.40163  ORF Transcript_13992/g.40163 Transcript_13992/m.40163 type:complete len:221 (+) Transcript_13992:3167-3829(+)